MKTWQFWLLFLALLGILAEIENVRKESREIFTQARWITWKMDQSGAERMRVDIAP